MFMPRKRTQTSCVGIYVSFCKKQYTLYKSCGLSCLGNLISSLCDLLLANLWTMRNNGKTVLIVYFIIKILRAMKLSGIILTNTLFCLQNVLGRQPQKFQLMKTTINHSHFRAQFLLMLRTCIVWTLLCHTQNERGLSTVLISS